MTIGEARDLLNEYIENYGYDIDLNISSGENNELYDVQEIYYKDGYYGQRVYITEKSHNLDCF